MSDAKAPERVWCMINEYGAAVAADSMPGTFVAGEGDSEVEYVRADLHAEALARAERAEAAILQLFASYDAVRVAKLGPELHAALDLFHEAQKSLRKAVGRE